MQVKKVTVLGGGVLGVQIAFQAAYQGFDTFIYDVSPEAMDKVRNRLEPLPASYRKDIGATKAELDEAISHLTLSLSLEKAVEGADAVIEAVPESKQIKRDTYQSLKPYIGKNTLLLTNTSTLLPRTLINDTPNPQRFMAMHFANQIWVHNIAELMWADGTPQQTIDDAEDFAKQLGMIPIKIFQEVPGYVMNSIFLSMINTALMLWGNDVASPKMIDKDWMVSMGVDRGPFGFVDIMGLNTALNIVRGFYAQSGEPQLQNIITKLEKMVADGKLGVETGEGFYTYPNPEYEDVAFTLQA